MHAEPRRGVAESAFKDLIGFFSTVVAMLGTLLGGVVAFYFARR
jgi:hypothetical protein